MSRLGTEEDNAMTCKPGQCEGRTIPEAGFGGQDMTNYCEPQRITVGELAEGVQRGTWT